MKVREGLVPSILGVAVTATGLATRQVSRRVGWGIAGFGLAHIVLGAIDLVQHRSQY